MVAAPRNPRPLPEIFQALADEAGDEQPGRGNHRGGRDENEGEGYAALDSDHLHASVGYREAPKTPSTCDRPVPDLRVAPTGMA
jgi:hypothetical protein